MLNNDEHQLLARIRAFAQDQVAPAAAAWGQGQAPTDSIQAAAAELGMAQLRVPVAHGGLGHSFALQAAACEVLAGADFGFAMSWINSHNVALKIAQSDNTDLQSEVLPDLLAGRVGACTALTEPASGSDFGGITTCATLSDQGDWVLNGEKTWIINARWARWCIVYAQTGECGDRHGIAAFVVDLHAPGVRPYALDSAAAQTSMGTGGFHLQAVRVPAHRVLIAPGLAFKSILNELNAARTYVAAMAVGMLEAAWQCTNATGHQRHSFGQPLRNHQAWRFALARASVALAGARALVQQAIDAVERQQDAALLSAQAKVLATDVCREQVAALMHLMGAEGLRPQHPFVRHLAAAQIASLTDGADEMLLERIAQLTR